MENDCRQESVCIKQGLPEILEASADWLGRSHLGTLSCWGLNVLHVFFCFDVYHGGLPIDHGIQKYYKQH